MTERSLFLKIANLLGINLPSPLVIYAGLILVILVPLVTIYQAYQLYKLGKPDWWVWSAIGLAVVVLGIYLYTWLKIRQILDKFHLRQDETIAQ